MPPNTNAAITGLTLVTIETGWIHQLLLSHGYTELHRVVVPAFMLYGLIGWFYAMHLYGLYEDTEKGGL